MKKDLPEELSRLEELNYQSKWKPSGVAEGLAKLDSSGNVPGAYSEANGKAA